MRAIQIISDTSDKSLQLINLPIPLLAEGQVLIKVAAAGINRPDILQRKGIYPAPFGASPILGLEVAGTIVEKNSNVTEFKLNDKVCALVNGGGYAEYCVADAVCCLPIPENLNFVQAAAIPETFFTVWSNLFTCGMLLADESVLIHGGGSGIGTTAIQLAKAFGSKVYTTVGSPEKGERCLELKADAAINYRQEDFVAAILSLTSGKGVNVILDIIGGDYFSRNLKLLSEEGRLLQIGIQDGAHSQINLWQIMSKRLKISGSTLRNRSLDFKANIAKQLKLNVWPLLESGTVLPVIDSVFSLENAHLGHDRLLQSKHFGKIILEF